MRMMAKHEAPAAATEADEARAALALGAGAAGTARGRAGAGRRRGARAHARGPGRAGGGLRRRVELRVSLASLAALLGSAGEDVGPSLQQGIRAAAARTTAALSRLSSSLGDAGHPFEHAGPSQTLARHVVPAPPAADDLEAVYGSAREALERFVAVYFRLLGRLAPEVEAAESEAGLSPIAAPVPAAKPA